MLENARRAESDAETSYAGWSSNVVASLDYMAATASLDLPAFKTWLVRVSGHLSPATFDRAMGELTALVERAVSSRLIFRLWDKDGSGSIDLAEMGAAMMWMTEHVPGTLPAKELLLAVPATPDGRLSEAAFEEWMLTISSSLSVASYTVLMEKLKDKLRENGEDPDGSMEQTAPIPTADDAPVVQAV